MDNQTSKSTPIKKAVIPIAGLGTRFLPATRSIPKPLLPVLNVPVIEYAVREAVDAGVTDIAIIMSPGMESVADYFKPKKQLERELAARGNAKLHESQLAIASLANLVTIYQQDPKGPGHAIMQAKGFCNGDPFLVIFPDDLIISKISATEQLLQVYREHGGSVIAVTEAPDEIIQTKGIVAGSKISENIFSVNDLVEKPSLEKAPSNLAIVARYILDNSVFDHLAKEKIGSGGEIQLTDAIAALIGNTPIHARLLSGFHADTGNPEGMLEAAIHIAKQDPKLRENLLNALMQ